MKEKFVEGTVQHALRVHIVSRYGTQDAAAKAWGCSGAMVSAVICGRKKPAQYMLESMGWERVVTVEYRPKWEGA